MAGIEGSLGAKTGMYLQTVFELEKSYHYVHALFPTLCIRCLSRLVTPMGRVLCCSRVRALLIVW